MVRFGIFFLFFIVAKTSIAQNSIDETIQKYNSGSVTYISVQQLKVQLEKNEDLVLLDTRSEEEYDVSHLKKAIWIGFKKFDEDKVENIDKETHVIVYCSVGVRSEKIGEELKTLGFSQIENLYGGIFEWINKGYPIYKDEEPTQDIHTFNKRWEQFIKRGNKVN